MKTTHLVASELFFVLLLAGCANTPMDQACRAGIERDINVLSANGHQLQYHRTLDFAFLLSEAEGDELVGDYQSCLHNLSMARVNHHSMRITASSRIDYPTQDTYQNNTGSANDAAHHAAGHTHHHGHN
jgi:hypothetical protein